MSFQGTDGNYYQVSGRYVPGEGNPSAKLMIVGEAPGAWEDEKGKPFVGPSGQMVNEILEEVGCHRSLVYCTNVVKYRPPNNKLANLKYIGKAIEDGIPQLFEEIGAIKPNAILALGNLALSTLTTYKGITKYRGSILQGIGGCKVIPSLHPAVLLHQEGEEHAYPYSTRAYISLDFRRAWEEALKGPTIDLPRRHVQIAHNFLDVYKFLKQYEGGQRRATIDIETIRCFPALLGIAFNPTHALSIPLIPIGGPLGSVTMSPDDFAMTWKLLAEFAEKTRTGEILLVGQNLKFDIDRLIKSCGFNFTKSPYWDTMLGHHTLFPEFPQSLAFIASTQTREPFYKDDGKEFDIQKEHPIKFLTYNGKDCCVESEVQLVQEEDMKSVGLTDFFLDFVMPLNEFYMEIEHEGLPINEKIRWELFDKYDGLEMKAAEELEKLIKEPVVIGKKEVRFWNSPKRVSKLLYQDLKLPQRAGTGEDVIASLLANVVKDEERRKILNLILQLRGFTLVKSRYILAKPDYDGKIKTSYRITGTETGRTSTAMVDSPVRPHKMGVSLQQFPKHGDYSDLRSMFVAPEGYEFIEVDQRQAEGYVVFLLAEDYEMLERLKEPGFDMHRQAGSWFFSIPASAITPDQRFVSKKGRHGGNYDMGKMELMKNINTDSRKYGIFETVNGVSTGRFVNVSAWKAGDILEKFHAHSPKVRGVYHEAVKKALVDNKRVLISPHGRRREFFDRWGPDLWKEAYATLPQATVSDHTKDSGIRIKKRLPWVRFCGELHDALLSLNPIERREELVAVIREEFEREIDFSRCTIPRGKLIIPCDIKIGPNYKDLHDYKQAA